MAVIGSEFQQFSYFVDNIYEPKKKNRFMLHIDRIPQLSPNTTAVPGEGPQESGLMLALISAVRPQYTVEGTEIARFNEKVYVAGTTAHSKQMSCEFNDYIDNSGPSHDTNVHSAGNVLYNWFNTVYNLDFGSMGFKKEYSTTANLYLLDPHGKQIEHWHYTNLWPLDVNWNDLTMTDGGVCTITSNFQYDKVKLISSLDTNAAANTGVYSSSEYS